jgi:hypothetical protein
MKTTIAMAGAALAVLLAGCATPYQSDNFSEQRLNADTFRVTMLANAHTPAPVGYDMQLLRVSETVLGSGFSHFVILRGGMTVDTTRTWLPASTYTTIARDRDYASALTSTTGGRYAVENRPRGDMTVKAYHAVPADAAPGTIVYDAAMVCQSIGPKYGAACVKGTAK